MKQRGERNQRESDMSLLLALCGDKRELSVKEVPLSDSVQKDVRDAFFNQEAAFRKGKEISFDENWLNERDEIAIAPIPANVSIFEKIRRSTDTSLAPIDANSLEDIRGLAIKIVDRGQERVLIQKFAMSQSLTRPMLVSLRYERGAYTRLTSSAFRLDDKLVCIVEGDSIKFRSLHNLGRVIDTSEIFRDATDNEVTSFAINYSNLFEIVDVDDFVAGTSRNARKYLASLARSGVLKNHTAETLQEASSGTHLKIEVRGDRIVMPSGSGEITELMRFLNDGRYVGPISGNVFITNSRRRVT